MSLLYYFKPLFRPNVEALYPPPQVEAEKPKRKKRKEYVVIRDGEKPRAASLTPVLEAVQQAEHEAALSHIRGIEAQARKALAEAHAAQEAYERKAKRIADELQAAKQARHERQEREFRDMLAIYEIMALADLYD